MAQQADGTVYINSSIDTDGVETGGKRLESAFKRVANTAKTAIGSIRSGMQSINQAMSTNLDTGGFDNLQDKVDTISEHLKSLESKGLSFGNAEYDQTYQQLVLAENELKQYKSTLAETALAEQNAAQTTGLMQSVLNALAGAAHAPISALQLLGNAIKQIPHATLNLVSNGLHKIADAAKNAAKKIGSGLVTGLKKAKDAMLSFHKSTQKSNGSLGTSLKTILKYGFGIRSLYALVNKVRSAIKEGFTNLYEQNTAFKYSVDNLNASLLTLKNALATAFKPIVEAAIPYIQRLIEWITKAANAFGQLIAALLGQKTYTKAIKQTTAALKEETKASNKQLSSLDKLNNLTSQNADDADAGTGGMFEEVPISDKFKDIAKWLKDMWENSDFYELGKWLGEKLKSVLDNIPWDKIQELAAKLGKSIASLINGFIEVEGLAYSIGNTLAQALNTIFTFFNAFVHELHWDSVGKFIAVFINGITQNVDWDLIYDTFVTLAKGLADALNSFNEWLDWDSIATTISNFFNTITDTLYTFITETDWIGIATNLGKTISDAFTGIDWNKVGQTVGEAFKALFSFIATTIENIDWWAVGIAVKDFLVGIDWAGVAEAFFEAIGAAIGGLAAFIGGLIGEGVENAKEYFQQKIEEAGGNVVEGILVSIAEALVGIGAWINEHIFTPFIDGFKKAFGINSPSTVMAEMGNFIVAGLLNGLKEKWNDIVTWIQDKIKWLTDKIQSMVKSIGSAKSALTGGLGSALGGALKGYSISVSNVETPVVSIPEIATAKIPYLASGAVIPPNAPFAAILGDQKNGNNLEMPESLLRKIVREESGNNDNGDINLNLTVECEGYQLLNIMQKLDRQFYKQNGRHAFA